METTTSETEARTIAKQRYDRGTTLEQELFPYGEKTRKWEAFEFASPLRGLESQLYTAMANGQGIEVHALGVHYPYETDIRKGLRQPEISRKVVAGFFDKARSITLLKAGIDPNEPGRSSRLAHEYAEAREKKDKLWNSGIMIALRALNLRKTPNAYSRYLLNFATKNGGISISVKRDFDELLLASESMKLTVRALDAWFEKLKHDQLESDKVKEALGTYATTIIETARQKGINIQNARIYFGSAGYLARAIEQTLQKSSKTGTLRSKR